METHGWHEFEALPIHFWVIGDHAKSRFELIDIAHCLFGTPLIGGVSPNIFKVLFGLWGEFITSRH
jgi:hypothetical protein